MTEKKWRPKRELASYWTKFLKNPICHIQEIWDIAQGEDRARFYEEKFWNDNKVFLRKHRISEKDAKFAFAEAIGKMKIYPYEKKEKLLLTDVVFELGKALSKRTSEQTFISWEESGEELSSGTDEEEVLVERIDQDRERSPEKLRKKGMTLRAIEKKTGIPKSTLHRKLKKIK